MVDNNYQPTAKEACLFLSEYAAWLLGCGATCIRIEKNVQRMSEAWNVVSEMMIMPSYVQITVRNDEKECDDFHSYSVVKKTYRCGISFNINTRLSKLSWDIADGKCGFDDARTRLDEITHTAPTNRWVVLLLASLANMSFCRLFNGDAVSMLIVFIATLMGYRLKQILLSKKCDVRVTFFCSAFVSSVIGAGGYIFGWGATPDIAIGTSVLYLVPGIPYINSVSDMIDGHYICAFGRFIDAALLTAALSTGLCGGMLVMGLKWL